MYAVPAAPSPPANDSDSWDVEQVEGPGAAPAWDVLVTVSVRAGAVCVTGAPAVGDVSLDWVVAEPPHPAPAVATATARTETADTATTARLRASGMRMRPDTSRIIFEGLTSSELSQLVWWQADERSFGRQPHHAQ